MIDIGSYHRDPERYQQLVDQMYEQHPGITLPAEYAMFVEKDLLRLMIRLARYKFVARMLKTTDRILEVGCGSGLGTIFLSQHCADATGIDVKTTEIAEARSINRRDNVHFQVGDLFDLPATERFDAVVALDVIEHMPTVQAHVFVQALLRRMIATGMLVIGSPSLYSLPYQSPMSQASHVKCYDQRELVELIETYCHRALPFSMNDETVHTGYAKMAWYYFVLAFIPRQGEAQNP